MGWLNYCQLCSSQDMAVLLDMGEQPLAEAMGSTETYPLQLRECNDCHLVQLGYAVEPEKLFPLNHPYASGNTVVLRDHYRKLARRLAGGLLNAGDLVVEIGANDGTLIGQFPPGLGRVAVEPTAQAGKIPSAVHAYCDFFTSRTAKSIEEDHGKAKLVLANNVLAHVPDPHEAVSAIWGLLADDGTLVSENHDVRQVLTGQVDTVYHEHLRYYSPATFARLLADCGLEVYRVEDIPTHGGSFRTWARRRTENLDITGMAMTALHRILSTRVGAGNTVYGVGATTRATPLIHFAGIASYITAVAEVSGSEKLGQNMPGTSIPVVDERQLLEAQPEYALLFSWHLADYLVPKLRGQGYQGKFIIPLPWPKVVLWAGTKTTGELSRTCWSSPLMR